MSDPDPPDRSGRPAGGPGLVTPLQSIGPESGRRAVLATVALATLLGVLAWQPWAGAQERPAAAAVAVAEGSPAAATPAPTKPAATPGPTTGPWSGRIAPTWSIVAFLRAEPVSRDPLVLVQEPVAVWPVPGVGTSAAGGPADCAARPVPGRDGGADLPGDEVRLLGVAFPAGRDAVVTRIVGLPDDLRAVPVDLGAVPGVGALLPAPATDPSTGVGSTGPGVAAGGPVATGSPATTGADPVRLYGLAGGVRWPNGVYRFELATRTGLPGILIACIR